MKKSGKKIFIIGYGNRYRQDDSLGSKMIDMLLKNCTGDVILSKQNHLSVDLAYQVSDSGATDIIFVDALINGDDPFIFKRILPEYNLHFSVSVLSPGAFLYLCSRYFDRDVNGYLLGIRGYEWDFKPYISTGARENLFNAYSFMKRIITDLGISVHNNYGELDE